MWIEENRLIFKNAVYDPSFFEMEDEEKNRVLYLLMKSCMNILADAETEFLNKSMSFNFESKEDFLIFNKAMNDQSVNVSSSMIEKS